MLDGLVTAANGDLDEGIVRVQDGLNGLRNVGADGGRTYALLTLGRLCLAGAQVQRGLEAVDESARACAASAGMPRSTSRSCSGFGPRFFSRSRPTSSPRRRICWCAPTRWRAIRPRACTSCAWCWISRRCGYGPGRNVEACDAIDASLQWFDEGESAQELALARALRTRIDENAGR